MTFERKEREKEPEDYTILPPEEQIVLIEKLPLNFRDCTAEKWIIFYQLIPGARERMRAWLRGPIMTWNGLTKADRMFIEEMHDSVLICPLARPRSLASFVVVLNYVESCGCSHYYDPELSLAVVGGMNKLLSQYNYNLRLTHNLWIHQKGKD